MLAPLFGSVWHSCLAPVPYWHTWHPLAPVSTFVASDRNAKLSPRADRTEATYFTRNRTAGATDSLTLSSRRQPAGRARAGPGALSQAGT